MMTKNVLLDEFKNFTETVTKNIVLPVRIQKGDIERSERAVDVYKMRLPDSNAAQKKAPYIIHQIITGEDEQTEGMLPTSKVIVRSVFCVYCDDEQRGALLLLELMERLRIELLRKQVLGEQFALDLKSKLETLVYPENTAPYYAGEMLSTWRMPTVEREVREWL